MLTRKPVSSFISLLLLLSMILGLCPAAFAQDAVATSDQGIVSEAETQKDTEILSRLSALEELLPGTEEEKADTKDVRGQDYVFLDFKVGSASRNFNWQVKTDSSKNPYFAANRQGLLAGYFSGNDPRLYMPVETHTNGLKRLGSYVLQADDIIQVRVSGITANDYFTSNGTGTYNSYFTIRTSNDVDAWASCGSRPITRKTEDQTIQWNTPTAQVGKTLYGLRWDPIQPTTEQQGTFTTDTRIYVDYIYVGPESTAPVSIQYLDEAGTLFSQGFGYIGYGKKAMDWSHGKTNSETDTHQTIWGWTVHQQINGVWTDMKRFITDPSTFTCKYNTKFRLTQVTVKKSDLSNLSTQTFGTGASVDDDRYQLTVSAVDLAEMDLGRYGKPLDVAIVLDRSGSMADLTSTKKLTTQAEMTTYLETLDKTKFPGYYRASCWRRNNNNGGTGGQAYVYYMPMRYYRGAWQMQVLKESCDCNATIHRNFGIYPWNSTGLKQCSHVAWVSMSAGYELYASLCEKQGYTVSNVPFGIGPCRLGKVQYAIETFLQKLYNSNSNLKKGEYHTVSLLGYGESVFISNYPYNDLNGKYKTSNNASCNKTSTQLDYTTYESVLSTLRNPYVYGATRTDCALQVLSGELSALEKAAGKTAATQTKTDYLPATNSARKRVVVLLTDGVPTANSEFNNTIATDAIDAARRFKNNDYTTVYTVGIMSGLDSSKYYTSSYATGTEAQKANNFLNLISSRYKAATDYNSAGTKTVGEYFLSDTSAGTTISNHMSTIWDKVAPVLGTTGKTGPASLWLHEEFGREWKLDSNDPIRIYAAPYLGDDTFGTKVLIGTHKLSSDEYSTVMGEGYKLHITPVEGKGFSVSLQWTDAKKSFLRETSLNTGSAAKAMNGEALDLSKGYRIFMEIPVELDRTRTLGGNNIPLTTANSGCYAAGSTADTAKGNLLVAYATPNANAFYDVTGEGRDYFIPLANYLSVMKDPAGSLKSVLDQMLRLPDQLRVTDEYGLSMADYVAFDVSLKTLNGTDLYHKEVAFGATALTTDVYNIRDDIVDLSMDQRFYAEVSVNHRTHSVDSFGRAPYSDINMTAPLSYYVPKIAVADYDFDISIPMQLEAVISHPSHNAVFADGVLNFSFHRNMLHSDYETVTYTLHTIDPWTGEALEKQRELYVVPASVMVYEEGCYALDSGWQQIYESKEQPVQNFDNTGIHGRDDNRISVTDLGNSVEYTTVSAQQPEIGGSFTFRGTGFELLTRKAPDGGTLLVEIYAVQNGVPNETPEAVFLADTYYPTTVYQVPLVQWNSGSAMAKDYYVQFKAIYHELLADHAVLSEDQLIRVLDSYDCRNTTYLPAQLSEALPAVEAYNVYVDACRVYGPSDMTELTAYAYSLAGEGYGKLVNLATQLVDAGADADFGPDTSMEGVLFFSENGAMEQPRLLSNNGLLFAEKEGNVFYLTNAAGARIVHPDYGTELYCRLRENGLVYYYCTSSAKEEVILSEDTIAELCGDTLCPYGSVYHGDLSKNELYLEPGQGIAFKIRNSDRLYLSARSVDGTPVTVLAGGGSSMEDNDHTHDETFLREYTATTSMYYDVSRFGKDTILLKNTGPGTVALGMAKIDNSDADSGLYIDYQLVLDAISGSTSGYQEPTVLEELKLSHTLSLQSDISVNYAVPVRVVEAYDAAYLECTLGDRTVELQGRKDGNYYFFTLTGINAVQMGETIRSVLYLYKDGQVYISKRDEYSVAQYAYGMLDRDGASDVLKTLCANLLRYGSAAQIFKGYNTENLVDAQMTDAHRAYLTDLDTVAFQNHYSVVENTTDPHLKWVGKSLSLDSRVALKFVIDARDFEGDVSELEMGVEYTDWEGNTKFTSAGHPEVYDASKGYYVFTFDGLLASELRSVVTVMVVYKEAVVSDYLTYSADTYGNNKTGTLLELCKALFAYSDSAKAFFA